MSNFQCPVQDGVSVPRGGRTPSRLPNPRFVSQKNHPDSDLPDPRFTHMVMQFGQFLDHDLTLTPKDGKHSSSFYMEVQYLMLRKLF